MRLRKVLTVFLSVVFALSALLNFDSMRNISLVMAEESSNSILNLTEMNIYADTYWKNYNPAYPTAGKDCCHFASQILIAGGLDSDLVLCKYVPTLIDKLKSDKFYNKYGVRVKYYNNYTGDDYPKDGVRDRAYFTIDDIEQGDFVTLEGDYGRHHIVYVLKVDKSSQKIYYAAHTTDAHCILNDANVPYSFSKIKGVLKTSELISSEQPVSDNSVYMFGDVNNNGEVSITDSVQLELVVKGKKNISEINARAADVNLDNAITSADVELLQQNIVSLNSLPAVNSYKCYYISPVIDTDLTIDVKGGLNYDETEINAYYKNGAQNQIFMVVPVYSIYTGTRKYYNRIIPLSDDSYSKCLNINCGNSYGNLQLYTFSGTQNELFTFEQVGFNSNQYYIKSALGGALTIENATDGANIFLSDFNRFSDNQKWVLTELSSNIVGDAVDNIEENDSIITTDLSENLTFSDNGVKMLCSYEGFSPKCYVDATQSSIGYGTKCTGSSVQPHAAGLHTTDKETALEEIRKQVDGKYAPRVKTQTQGLSMTQHQFDALVSLCYNTGGGTSIIAKSPLVKYLKGELTEEEARVRYSQYYVKSNGKKLSGLVSRRNKEADLFFTDTGNVSATTEAYSGSSKADMELLLSHPYYISYFNANNNTEVVKSLQRLLNKCGYNLEVDGVCENATRNAICAFQRSNGLTVDGLFGTASKNKLKEVLNL